VFRLLLGTGALLAGALGLGCCAFSAPRYQGPRTDHFDGERFRNPVPTETHGFGDFLRWMRERERGSWDEVVGARPGAAPPYKVLDGELRVTFVNHATLLVQLDGWNVLTDPIWSERASPVFFAGPKRVRPPGLRFEDLPPIHAVVVSHNHYDHLDLPTLRRLEKAFSPTVFVGLGNKALLERAGLRKVVELDWWQGVKLGPSLEVIAAPAQHFANRGLCDAAGTLWASWVLRSPHGAVYFGGDTGYGPHFGQVAERFAPIRLAMLPIGAFRPEWFMARVHTSPDEALLAHRELGAQVSVAMHFGTFALADDGRDEAPQRLREALAMADEPADRFWILDFGEGRPVPPPAQPQTRPGEN
jgi:L-ascorbate metabolism protein UlaG (beta-lactamase superfamily)